MSKDSTVIYYQKKKKKKEGKKERKAWKKACERYQDQSEKRIWSWTT